MAKPSSVEHLRYDQWVIAERAGRPIGVMQICDAAHEESHYRGEIERGFSAIDIWIGEESDLSHGYGTTMMQLALQRCFADPADESRRDRSAREQHACAPHL